MADALPVNPGLARAAGVVLAGGFGTRLRPVLEDRPKALAEVAGRPFLYILLDQLADAGIGRIVLCTGHLGGWIRELIGDSYRGIPVRYSHEESPLGTGGALRQAFARYPADLFLVMNGDSYVAADLAAFGQWHHAAGRPGSLLLAWASNCARFGTVQTGPGARIARFTEKCGAAEPGWINGGVYLFSRALLEALPPGAPLSLEHQVFPAWIARGLGGYRLPAPFLDIGTPSSLAAADAFLGAHGGRRLRKRFAVLDRDGTIIAEKNYLGSPDDVELLPGAATGVKRLADAGLGIVVVSNQAGIGRGYFTASDACRVNARMAELLAESDAAVDAVYFCPHVPEDDCRCRKPKPGMLLAASAEWGFDPAAAFVAGDKACDIDLGRNCGSTTFLVQTGYGREQLAGGAARPDFVVADLAEAAAIIEGILKDSPPGGMPA